MELLKFSRIHSVSIKWAIAAPTLSLLLWATVLSARTSATFSEEPPSPNQVIYLGSSNGKLFFLDDTAVNWTSASERCRAAHMELASIETAAQTGLLVGAIRELNFTGSPGPHFWTSGREYHHPSTFVWNNTGEFLNGDVATPWYKQTPLYYYCVSLSVTPGEYHYHGEPCENLERGTLCQL